MLTRNTNSLFNDAGFTNLTPLPLNWLSFTAVKIPDAVLLNWTVANEENIMRYDVFRRLSNQQDFFKIAEVKATGPSIIPLKYHMVDNQTEVLKNTVFYQIRSISNSGESESSVIRSVQYVQSDIKNLTVKVWPNPANTVIHAEVTGTKEFRWELMDVSGKTVSSGRCAENAADIDAEHLVPGVYMLRIINDLISHTEKVIITR